MSTAKTAVRIRSVRSFADWFASHWFEHFVLVYDLWVFLIFLAPVFMRFGWNRAGQAIFFIYFIFLIPIHATIFLFVR